MLMHHDTTETQTDCPRPLSRKKLKRLMWRNLDLTTANLKEKIGRRIGLKFFSRLAQKRQERRDRRSSSRRGSSRTARWFIVFLSVPILLRIEAY